LDNSGGLPEHLVVGFTPPKEDVYDPFLENVIIGILQIPKQVTLDQFVQLTINKNPDFKIRESSQTSLCSMPARRIVYDDDRGMRHLWTIAFTNIVYLYQIVILHQYVYSEI
jgi:hypothetical protein